MFLFRAETMSANAASETNESNRTRERASLTGPTDADAIDAVDRPALVWWVLVLGGLTILALDSWDPAFYAWWTSHVNPLPGQAVMAWVFVACVPIHAGEAIYVNLAAKKSGLALSRAAWTVQTLILGYPSTHLFRKKVRRRSAIGASSP